MIQILVSPAELRARLANDDWRVVDCRAVLRDPDAGRRAFADGHIPGAVHADLERDLSGPVRAHVTGRHPLPERDVLAATFSRWGIDDRTRIVAYDERTAAYAARLWWLARWLGHENVSVLDGGLAAWRQTGGPLSTEASLPAPRRFEARSPLTRTIDADSLLAPAPHRVLLDARAPARYRGEEEPIDPVAGHIPGALNAPYEENLDAEGRFHSPATLRTRFTPLVADSAEIVCYCGSGVTACHDVLALTLAGFDEPVLYPGSWSEWITDRRRPIA